MENKNFDKIFWFVIGLVSFAAMLTLLCIFLPITKGNERFADQSLVFWLTTGAGGGIGYLIGSSVSKTKPETKQIEEVKKDN
jgi:hypothetical protein